MVNNGVYYCVNNSDVNILESGLFFRLDASNVLEKNIASVIMPIGLDHKDFLKKGTINEIVYEKCSHLLNNSKIIIAEQKEDVLKLIKKNILTNTSNKIFFKKNYSFIKKDKGFVFNDKLGKINLPPPSLLGDFQLSNITTAVATARALTQFNINNSHIKKAIKKIEIEGRLQNIIRGKLRKYVSKKNKIIVDGAHNPMAAYALKKYIETLDKHKKVFMVLAMMANKEHKEFINILKNSVYSITTLNIPNQINFIKKEKLKKIAQSLNVISNTENSIKTALKKISKQNDNAIIICTGSLYFVGEILNLN